MRNWLNLWLFGLMDAVDAGAGGAGTAQLDLPGTTDAPPPTDPPAAAATTPVDGAPAADATTDPALSAFEQIFKAEPDATADPNAPPPATDAPLAAVPQEFSQALTISEFVREPAQVAQAVRAADEVWRVAAGQAPASGLLEGMRAGNPQGFEKVIGDLVPYIEQVTGKKFGAVDGTPPDPMQARLDAMEQRFQQEEQARQSAVYAEQVSRAHDVALDAVKGLAKGTFLEGSEEYALAQLSSRVGVPEQQMVNMLLQGKTEPLAQALKTFQREEDARMRRYVELRVKQHKTLQNAVPATAATGAAATSPQAQGAFPPRKADETDAQYATRLWESGK